MRYGLPYKGSKNAIAEWVINQLPSAEYFIDLFFGGGAITHRALLSHKYKRFIINDIDGRLPKLFLDCVHGKYTVDNHKEWWLNKFYQEGLVFWLNGKPVCKIKRSDFGLEWGGRKK